MEFKTGIFPHFPTNRKILFYCLLVSIVSAVKADISYYYFSEDVFFLRLFQTLCLVSVFSSLTSLTSLLFTLTIS